MRVAEHPLSCVTDVEVLRGFAMVTHERIAPVHEKDIHLAARPAEDHLGISARDLVHAAVMQRLGIDRIISSDADCDRLPGIGWTRPISPSGAAPCCPAHRTQDNAAMGDGRSAIAPTDPYAWAKPYRRSWRPTTSRSNESFSPNRRPTVPASSPARRFPPAQYSSSPANPLRAIR